MGILDIGAPVQAVKVIPMKGAAGKGAKPLPVPP